MIDQVVITVCGLPAIWLAYCNGRKPRFVGACLGLASQPAYFYMAWTNHLWGIFIVTVLYAGVWGSAVYVMWPRRSSDVPATS